MFDWFTRSITAIIVLISLIAFSGCVSSSTTETKDSQKAKTETSVAAATTSGPRTEKISFAKASDDWKKGGITSGDGTVTVAPLMDMRVFSVGVKIPAAADLAYIELEVKSDNFEAAWGGKVCGFEINGKVVDPVGMSTVSDPDGWHWVVADTFEDGLLYVQLPVPGSVIKSISAFIGGNESGTLTFSKFNAVYK